MEISLSATELAGIKNKQLQRLIGLKLEAALAVSLATLKADPKATQIESVKAYLQLLEQVQATKAKPTRKRKVPASSVTA